MYLGSYNPKGSNPPANHACRTAEAENRSCPVPVAIVRRLNCYCHVIWGDLLLREGDTTEAEAVVRKAFRLGLGKWSDIVLYALKILGDRSLFLARFLKSKQKPGTYKARQFLGDAFASQNDENTAISLFTIGLEGFTYLDVHRSRAECMLRFEDISERTGHLPRALEHWEKARPLFQRSSQAKRVENIDRRLANIDEDLKERYRNQLASAAELKSQDEVDDLSEMEDLELDD
ncbi:hypothetical protein B0H14DRAFT_2640462 [Mycena olivaceomarginata]|nr:hypothetical protein B0H14DRAFT_2640462 [Mycena olivaceomarginata]